MKTFFQKQSKRMVSVISILTVLCMLGSIQVFAGTAITITNPDFTDDLSGYNSGNAFYSTKSYKDLSTEEKAIGGGTTVAKGADVEYILSTESVGALDNKGFAYVHDHPVAGRRFIIKGYGGGATHNFGMGVKLTDDVKFLNGFSVDAMHSYDCAYYVRFFMNDAENTYYELGITGWMDTEWQSTYGTDWTVNPNAYRHPYLKYQKDGVTQFLEIDDATTTMDTYYTLAAKVTGTTLECSISGNNMLFYRSLNLENQDMGTYVLSLGVRGDPPTIFKNIKIAYEANPTFIDNEDGTVSVRFIPSKMDAANGTISIIFARYDEDKSLENVFVDSVAASETSKQTFIFNKSTIAGSYGKIFIWDGGLSNVTPLYRAIDVN